MGKVVTAPEIYVRPWHQVAVFLAGGITGCDDWQEKTAISIALNTPDNVIVLNPRRNYNMDPTDVESAREQISWEYNELEDSDFAFFWFPAGGPCPITLFELGKEIVKAKARGSFNHLYVGCHPEYNRRLDVMIQLELAGFDDRVYSDLNQMTDLFLANF